MTDKPKSIRMNKAHRDDMLAAVMQQWAKANPAPAGSTYIDFIKSTLTMLLAVPKSAPPEMRALVHLVNTTKKVIALKKTIPAELANLVQIREERDWRITTVLEDGSPGSQQSFTLPRRLADELGIPYLSTYRQKKSHAHASYLGYVTYDPNSGGDATVEFVCMANQSPYNQLVIPRDYPPYVAYTSKKRELNLWEEEKRKVREEIRDYLEQFNTTGQIRDQWPEMVDYLPAHIADPARVINLPALTRSRLNERLGIA